MGLVLRSWQEFYYVGPHHQAVPAAGSGVRGPQRESAVKADCLTGPWRRYFYECHTCRPGSKYCNCKRAHLDVRGSGILFPGARNGYGTATCGLKHDKCTSKLRWGDALLFL